MHPITAPAGHSIQSVSDHSHENSVDASRPRSLDENTLPNHSRFAYESPAADAGLAVDTSVVDTTPQPSRTDLSESESMALTEHKIHSVLLQLSTLRSQRNAFSPVSKLPTELLARIFRFHARHPSPPPPRVAPPYPPGSDHDSRLGWIAVTHVCRQWRQAALEDNRLWERVSFALPPEWVEEILSRAGAAPIEIVLDVFDDNDPSEAWGIIFDHLHHTRSISLYGLSPGDLGTVNKLLSTPAPMLTGLELGLADDRTPLVDLRQILNGTTIFGEEAPKLSELSLYRFANPWEFVPRGSLTSLRIKFEKVDLQEGASAATTWDGLMYTIANNPNLRTLSLDFCLPSPSSSWYPHHYGVVTLPQLEYLSVGGKSHSVFKFLTSMRYPLSTYLDISCSSEQATAVDACFIIPLLAAHFGIIGAKPLRSMCLKVSNVKKRLDIFASRSLPPDNHLDPMRTFFAKPNDFPCFELHFGLELEATQPHDISALMHQIFSILPLAYLEYLRIYMVDAPLSSRDWIGLFSRCNLVNTVYFTGAGLPLFLQALTDGIPNRQEEDTDPADPVLPTGATGPPFRYNLFPWLGRLVLSGIDFTSIKSLDTPIYQVLQSTLRHRIQSGAPLQELHVECCKFGPHREREIAELGDLLPDLYNDFFEPLLTHDCCV
ncbi:hypothetical protein BC834DRAFT_889983 [Gloeopeniophorella convolvens]|nr:hypothetical protein BC834DRAFT_889983 [Gloeopeniophorella convolvens]